MHTVFLKIVFNVQNGVFKSMNIKKQFLISRDTFLSRERITLTPKTSKLVVPLANRVLFEFLFGQEHH